MACDLKMERNFSQANNGKYVGGSRCDTARVSAAPDTCKPYLMYVEMLIPLSRIIRMGSHILLCHIRSKSASMTFSIT